VHYLFKNMGLISPLNKLFVCILQQHVSLTKRLELRTKEYNDMMRTIFIEIKAVNELKQTATNLNLINLREREQTIGDLQLKLEVIEADLDEIRTRLSLSDEHDDCDQEIIGNKSESSAAKMIANLAVPTLRSLLWDILHSMTETEVRYLL